MVKISLDNAQSGGPKISVTDNTGMTLLTIYECDEGIGIAMENNEVKLTKDFPQKDGIVLLQTIEQGIKLDHISEDERVYAPVEPRLSSWGIPTNMKKWKPKGRKKGKKPIRKEHK